MPLFTEDAKEENKESLKMGLAQLGGLAAGTGAGVLARMPIDARYQDKLLREGISLTRSKNEKLQTWDILFQLYNGQITLEDLPVGMRDKYRTLLEKNADDLKHFSRYPEQKRTALKDLGKGRVVPLFGKVEKTPLPGLPVHVPLEATDPNKVVPLFGPVTSQMIPEKLHSPYSKLLPGTLGMAGLFGAGKAYQYFKDKEPSPE